MNQTELFNHLKGSQNLNLLFEVDYSSSYALFVSLSFLILLFVCFFFQKKTNK